MRIKVVRHDDLGVYRAELEPDRSVRLVPEDGPGNAPSIEPGTLIEIPGGPLDGFYRVAESPEDGSIAMRRETSAGGGEQAGSSSLHPVRSRSISSDPYCIFPYSICILWRPQYVD